MKARSCAWGTSATTVVVATALVASFFGTAVSASAVVGGLGQTDDQKTSVVPGRGEFNAMFVGGNTIRVEGWDRNPANLGDIYTVAVEIDGTPAGSPQVANKATPAMGPDDAPGHGFVFDLTAEAGTREVCVYEVPGHSAVGDCITVVVTGKPAVFGVDVNSSQKGIDFATVKRDGAQFVIVKASGFNTFNGDNDHTPYVAPNYVAQVEGARNAGLPVGHFYLTGKVTVDQTIKKQAAFFVANLKNFDRDRDVLALDDEHIDDNGEFWTDAKAAEFLREVIRLTGIPANRVWLYVGASDARTKGPWTEVNKLVVGSGPGTGVRIWWASRGVNPIGQTPDHTPVLNGAFPWWDIHQFTDRSPVAGKNVDGNFSIRTVEELFNLPSAVKPPVVVPPVVDAPVVNPPVVVPPNDEGSSEMGSTVTTQDHSENVSPVTENVLASARVNLQLAVVHPGDTAVAVGSGFQPGENVAGVMNSNSIRLGTQVADSNGDVTFTWVIPDNIEVGAHHEVVLTGQTSETTATGTLEVIPRSLVAALAPTGLTTVTLTVAVALLLLVMGMLVIVSHRRSAKGM